MQSTKARIGKLIDIADTCLDHTDGDHKTLVAAIESKDALQRFWAATSLASFAGNRKTELGAEVYESAKQLLTDDNTMVRGRAAEAFYVLSGDDPIPTLRQCLQASSSELEALWLLNAITFAVDFGDQKPAENLSNLQSPHQGGEIDRRVRYLTPTSAP